MSSTVETATEIRPFHFEIPDEKILIPGVIDSTTNFVEHPRLVAQRICRPAVRDLICDTSKSLANPCAFCTSVSFEYSW